MGCIVLFEYFKAPINRHYAGNDNKVLTFQLLGKQLSRRWWETRQYRMVGFSIRNHGAKLSNEVLTQTMELHVLLG